MTHTTQVNPNKIAQLDNIALDPGSHIDFTEGHCAMEVVSWLADEGFTDAPECASQIIRDYTITLNDRWKDEKRQSLKPFLVAMIGTGSDGKEDVRKNIILREFTALSSPWLRLAGLDSHADALDAAKTEGEIASALADVDDAAWSAYVKAHAALANRMEAEIRKRCANADAVVIATAAADAVVIAAAAVTSDAVDDAFTAASGVINIDSLAVVIAAAAVTSIAEAAREAMEHQIKTSDSLADFRKLRDEQEGAALRILDLLIKAEQ